MNSFRYRRINALADEALNLRDTERTLFLDHACAGDTELREQVEELIEAHSSENDFLDAPVLELLAKDIAGMQLSADLSELQIHHYKVISRLGSGGIGEVWLAKDTQLTREVALKLLSPQFAGDPDCVRRFRREARAASLLNHPNIVTIYEIETWNGADFIAEEFVPGETLRQHIQMGPMAAAQVLDIGVQVAAALAAAHNAGIVHRDIKPENIMVRADGVVKVLDFGLAQFVEQPAGIDESISHPGLALGTIKYMSPEQARGLPVGASTDVFSLGGVLYEMLSGRPAFSGPTPTDILGAILYKEPPSLVEHSVDLSPEFERIVHRCLEKDPAKRYASANELWAEMRSLAQAHNTNNGPAARDQALHKTAPLSGSRHLWALPMLAGLVLLAISIFLLMLRKPSDAAFDTMKIARLATRGESTGAAISEDGKYVAYVLRDETGESIWTTQLATGTDVRVIAPEHGEHVGLKFSSDGDYLYYRLNTSSGAHDLYRVSDLGGTPLKIMDDVPGSIAFAPDGKRLAFVRIDPIRLEASLTVADLDGSELHIIRTHRHPQYYSRNGIAWSPDGSSIACFTGKSTGFSLRAFQPTSVRLADGAETSLSSETWPWVDSIAWSGNGAIVINASSERQDAFQIWRIAPHDRRVTRLTNDLSNYRRVTLTRDGRTLVALQTRREVDLWVEPLGAPEIAAKVVLENVHGMNSLAWSGNDKILFSALSGDRRNIWTVDADGTNSRQISAGPSDKQELAVSRDNRYLLYSSRGRIWRMNPDGGNPVQLTREYWDVHPTSSADSRFVVYTSFRDWSPALWGKPTLWKVPIEGGDPIQVSTRATSLPQVSPDGSKIACNYYPGPNPEYSASPMAVFSVTGGPPLRVFENISLGGTPVFWMPDGKKLIYESRRNGDGNLWRQSLTEDRPIQITSFRTGDLFAYAPSQDFKKVALAHGKETSDIVLISNFK
jgi:serine/threonine protein kinase/sugar lactone lactonase YvrE